MLVPYEWLKEYVDCDLSVDEVTSWLTNVGLEVEDVERHGANVSGVVVGEILEIDPHPNADKLVVCRVDVGDGERTIVCGARNMKVGDKVPTALVGACIESGLKDDGSSETGKPFKIGKAKLRGVASEGMMCSGKELGVDEDATGLLILEPDSRVGADVRELLGLDDTVFDIYVTAVRPDCASIVGVAREVSVCCKSTVRVPSGAPEETGPPVENLTSVTIDAPDLCPRYAARVIQGVAVGPSPAWLVSRLHKVGLRSINNVVDVTNYVLMELGHPLHAFDYDTLGENRIVVRRANAGETITSIDGIERELTSEMLVIADASRAVAVAGVMGGSDTEVSDSTTNVLLESAYFEPRSIRTTARKLALPTEASYRFERGADLLGVVEAIDRATCLILDLCGGACAAGVFDCYPAPATSDPVVLRPSRVARMLGAEITDDEVDEILGRLGFAVSRDAEGFVVDVPSFRRDIKIETDLIEEVARIYGYDRLPAVTRIGRVGETAPDTRTRSVREAREILAALGMSEVVSLSFSNPELVEKARLGTEYRDMLFLMNPLSDEQPALRTSLVPGLLSILGNRSRHGGRNSYIFEVGRVFTPTQSDLLPQERQSLGLAVTGAREPVHWGREEAGTDFFDLKGIVFEFAERLRVPRIELLPDNPPTFARASSVAIAVDGKRCGVMGEVTGEVLDAFEIDGKVYLAEIDLDALLQSVEPTVRYKPHSKFPASSRDLAVVVDEGTKAGDMTTAIWRAGTPVVVDVVLFDLYRGKPVEKGKKSLAFAIRYQADDRTLTESEIDEVHERVLRALEQEFKALRR